MPRQRRGWRGDGEGGDNNIRVREKRKRSSANHGAGNRVVYGYVALIASVIVLVFYLGFQYSRKIQVATPLNKPPAVIKTGLQVPDRFWGTYRPGCYFSLKARTPQSPVFGLMWFSQAIVDNQLSLRHWCEQNDNLLKYGWLEHDGVNFGKQVIEEKYYNIVTEFVKRPGGQHGGDWTARVSVLPKVANYETFVSVIFYVALDGQGRVQPVLHGSYLAAVQGDSEELGPFRVSFETSSNTIKMANYLMTVSPGVHMQKETILKSLAIFQLDKAKNIKVIGLVGSQMKGDNEGKQPNFLAYQTTFTLPFEMEIVFESGSFAHRPNRLIRDTFSQELKSHQTKFDAQFENTFHLSDKGYSNEEMDFAKACLSNLVGGIGYFYGSSLVQSQYNVEPIKYWPAPLYTSVPSRSFFPRGFLWDEGFHDLLICQWNVDICKDIIAHWLDLMNKEGWIPREQILGPEARSKVPDEFVVQRNTNANPPTLFLSLQYMLRKLRETNALNEANLDYFQHIFPRLETWFEWFNATQIGKLGGTYRWRGRDPLTNRELNPKTLTSGLDDFPRASHPTDDERHVDLRCWMMLAAGVMGEIAEIVGAPSSHYKNMHSYLSDEELLNHLHWSPVSQSYSDFGLHTNKVKLERPKIKVIQPGKPIPKPEKVRVVYEEPQLQYVDSYGYISLFPFLTHVISPHSPKLGKVLSDLTNSDLLWTKFGLRSLAKNSLFYMKYNTEHDPPYWRGAIWINVNFLALRALHHYAHAAGPYQQTAKDVYRELKTNVVSNMFREYNRTGFLWEQYNDASGFGQGSHPFTGWSALVVLIMGDSY